MQFKFLKLEEWIKEKNQYILLLLNEFIYLYNQRDENEFIFNNKKKNKIFFFK